jgi:hypothetical protein
MNEQHGRASLQFVEQRGEKRVAEVDAAGVAEQHDAIEPEVIEGIGQFGQRSVDVGQWQAGEPAVPVGAVADHLGGQFIASSCQYAGGGVVAGVHTGSADRGDGDVDAGVVEERQCTRARPGRRRDAAYRVAALVGGLPEVVGQDVVMGIHGEGHGSLPSGIGDVLPQRTFMVLVMGSRRIRVPVRAAIALVRAGAAVGTLTSPTPVGGSPDSISSTSICGTDFIRMTG